MSNRVLRLPRCGEVQAFPRHGEADQLGNAGGSRSGAKEQEALVGELLPVEAQGSKDAGQRHPGSALDVVVEGADLLGIARQNRHRVHVGKILPLDAASRIKRLDGVDELVDEGQILRAAQARLAKAEIEGVLEQLLIVRADVQDDRQAILGRYAGAGRVERKLAEWDAHPAGAEIAEAEDALAVGHHDEAHILFGPVAKQLLQPAARADRQIHAARLAEDMAEFLARLADGRGIDQWHVGRGIRHQERVEQGLVPRLEVR